MIYILFACKKKYILHRGKISELTDDQKNVLIAIEDENKPWHEKFESLITTNTESLFKLDKHFFAIYCFVVIVFFVHFYFA